MKAISVKRMSKLAIKVGWKLARIQGSHHVFVKDGRMERVVIPVHGNKSLKIGLQRALMKIIPLSEQDL